MDARLLRIGIGLAALASLGATHSTPNFVVTAPTDDIARQVGAAAEHYRSELAKDWLGKELPRWYRPCPIAVKVGQMGAGGATSFSFDRGEVFGWNMTVQGSLERILDSVIPHEVSHTILACHFRCPLPRWADEGAATLAENDSEKLRQQKLVEQVLKTSRRIPLRQLMAIREYPTDMQNVLTLYAEGYALANFLVQQGGKRQYLRFLEEALAGDWDQALRKHYNHDDIDQLEKRWSAWIVAGSPSLVLPEGEQIAAADARPKVESSRQEASPEPPPTGVAEAARLNPPEHEAVVRGQSPDEARRRSAAAPFGATAPPRSLPRGRSLLAPNPRGPAGARVVQIELGEAAELSVATTAGQSPGLQTAVVTETGTSVRLADDLHEYEAETEGQLRALNAGWIPVDPGSARRDLLRQPGAQQDRAVVPQARRGGLTATAAEWARFPEASPQAQGTASVSRLPSSTVMPARWDDRR